MYKKILKEIQSYNTIIIHRHTKPDGDAMGSQIGLKHILKETYPEKNIYVVGDPAGRYDFMEDSIMDEIEDCVYEGALAIVLDCGSSHLISDNRYKLAAKTVRFDHHIFCEEICDLEVVDTSFESCCGLVTDFAKEVGFTFSSLAAQSLYTGMVPDSGRFRYDSTTSKTFALASFLCTLDFEMDEIYRNLYSEDFEGKKLRASFLLKVQFTPKNVAYIYTTLDEFNALGLDTFTGSRGMVNTMGDLKGMPIWVNFTETE